MQRLGLALSGGGFRATLYHLGVVRLLRDAGILSKITHITTVSGGSILGAHLALNWERYSGTPEEFDEAAAEIIRFVQLDVRNRIVRRFPVTALANRVSSMLFQGQRRQWTRAGLLERYYERFLFGETSLSQLPDHPRLHILATNLSEGCLCSFNRNGLLMQRRIAGRRDRFERVQAGLATVPMAVAASSCFPGFFPPLVLTGWDVGADVGEFSRQAFTDGGVYDNLGLRMFRCLERGVRLNTPLQKDDFLEFEDVMAALRSAETLPTDTPLGRLRKLVENCATDFDQSPSASDGDRFANAMIRGLREVIRSEKLYHDPVFENIELDDPSAQTVLNYAMDSRREPEVGDQLWLNRLIVDAALSQVIGKPCLRINRKTFDGILVSDAGGKFKVSPDTRGGGLVSTALRSSDILMDRVWQLESEVFEHASGVFGIPIFDVVDRAKDPHALDPEVQRQTSKIRTDLDHFSDLEISSLTQHGYCVARQICRQNPKLIDSDLPTGMPWNPIRDAAGQADRHEPESSALKTAQQLRDSSKRKIFSTLFNLRDWPSYVWLLLIACLAMGIPYFVIQRSERIRQQDAVLSAVAQLNPDYRRVLDLLQHESVSAFTPMEYEAVATMDDPDLSGFDVISDSRVYDLRGWTGSDAESSAMGYNRTRVRRLPDSENNSVLLLQRDFGVERYLVDCKSAMLNPKLSYMELDDGLYRWQLQLDFSQVPLSSHADIVSQSILPPEMASAFADKGRFNFTVRTKTGLLQVWLLMPENREYGLFEVSSHPIGQPELNEIVVPAATVRVAMGSVATFRLINPEPNRRYECRWTWGKPTD